MSMEATLRSPLSFVQDRRTVTAPLSTKLLVARTCTGVFSGATPSGVSAPTMDSAGSTTCTVNGSGEANGYAALGFLVKAHTNVVSKSGSLTLTCLVAGKLDV